MAKRIFAVLAVATICGAQSQLASAASVAIKVDGCAQLARAVYSEVFAAVQYGPNQAGPWTIDSTRGDIAVCKTASRTVSRAYTSAMQAGGFDITWRGRGGTSGDYCDSHYLSQCYPDRSAYTTMGDMAEPMFVRNSWSAVTHAVMQQMHNPVSSNEVRFRENELKLRLGLSLRLARSAADH